jgi:ribosome-associated heat shock protein Hsp15
VDGVRIDRWLCAARVFKSRTQATQACAAGHVRLNDGRARPDQRLRPGDLIEVESEVVTRILAVVALAERRLSPALARELYEDRTPARPRKQKEPRVAPRERGSGRPTKRQRRNLDRLRSR